MLTDPKKREKAIQQITEARQVTSGELSNFQLPQTLNLEAYDHGNMINCECETITLPSILENVKNYDLLQVFDGPLPIDPIL